MPRALIIYNPIAGSGNGAEVALRTRRRLVEAGWDVSTEATRDRTGATDIARAFADRTERIIVAGGDGTLREAIEGLGEHTGRVELGLLPIGNANVAARELGIPLDAEAAARVLTHGKATAMDLGVYESSAGSGLFFAMVGIGWDAATVRLLDMLRHTTLGRAWYRIWADSAYVLCGLLAMLQRGQPRFEISVDGTRLPERFRGATLCNLRTYGKGMAMAPDAHPQSGRIHYQGRMRSAMPAVIWHLIAGLLRRRVPRFISRYGDGRRLHVVSTEALPIQIDGDFLGYVTEVAVEVLPAAVRIIVPSTKLSA